MPGHLYDAYVLEKPRKIESVIDAKDSEGNAMSVEFFDVEGIPVTSGNIPGVGKSSAAWDVSPPRVFDPGSTRRNGAPLSKEEFLAMLKPEVRAWADAKGCFVSP